VLIYNYIVDRWNREKDEKPQGRYGLSRIEFLPFIEAFLQPLRILFI